MTSICIILTLATINNAKIVATIDNVKWYFKMETSKKKIHESTKRLFIQRQRNFCM